MKLYFSPGACSLSAHIAFREAGLDVGLERVDLKEKKTKSGADYRAVNPKGSVPALALDDGQVLTEAAVIMQYLADKKPEAKLVPPAGSFERYREQEWLNYIASEIHKGIGALWNPKASDEWKAQLKEGLVPKFEFLSKALQGKPYLMGERFSVADGYLYTILRWTKPLHVDLGRWPTLTAFMQRVEARPAVQAALKIEGLIK